MNAVATAPLSLAPNCPYCGKLAVFLPSSEQLYRGHDFGPVWICWTDDAWVGCHASSNLPKGSLANLPLRRARMNVHDIFDPIWLNAREAYPGVSGGLGRLRGIARTRAYQWLAEQLGIPARDCHIGMFDLVTCRRAIEVLERERPSPVSIRSWAKARGEVSQ